MRYELAIALLSMSILASQTNAADDWRTRAERTGYRETSRYDETVAYCRRLDAASPWVTYTSFGRSPEGRDLPLLILSKDGAATADAARRSGRPVVLVQNGIHAGEIAGKEASLALAREIAVTKSLGGLLDHATLLVVPIFNVDGHERVSPYNRINQNGPAEMGWRTTAQNLNINRDYMKLDAPETRAMIALFNEWQPDVYIDNHVTDGADYQYDVAYTLDARGDTAPAVAEWIRGVFQPHVRPALEAGGHVVEAYFELVDGKDVSKGVVFPLLGPRYSNGYGALRNRPTILVETHMLKTFEQRVKAHYDLMVETLREVDRDPVALRAAVRAADEASSAIAGREVAVAYALSRTPRRLTFRGNAYRHELSEISGDVRVIYEKAPRDLELDAFDGVDPTTTVVAPRAYLIPAAWTAVTERLKMHGVRLERLSDPVAVDVEVYRFEKATWSAQPFEGRHRPAFTVVSSRERREVPAGTIVVPTDQPLARLAVHLLEPQAPDSFAAWGFFDAVFEQKEYGEHYAVEALAREMLAKDPALKTEFERRLRTDDAFRADAAARLDFFYRRSPYWDERKDVYPVLRLMGAKPGRTAPF